MIRALDPGEGRHGILLAAALLLGLALATAGFPWEAGAAGLGLGLAAVVGLAQTCSA